MSSKTFFADGVTPESIRGLCLNGKRYPAVIEPRHTRWYIHFSYNPSLIEEIKVFDGAKYHGFDKPVPEKVWSVTQNDRNFFQLRALAFVGKDPRNPYTPYNVPLTPFPTSRNLYVHQAEMKSHGLIRHYCEFAVDMGAGKSLAAIEIMEASGYDDWIWVAPRSALISVKLECEKWKCKVRPTFVTYEGLKKMVAEWPAGKTAPHGMIVDECSRCKNPTAQRTIAVRHVADSIRNEHGINGYVILMSGTPSPKSPADWYSQAEIACPGFLREGNLDKFKKRLALIEMREQFAGGGAYPHLVTWRDSEEKCHICGLPRDGETHDLEEGVNVFGNNPLCHVFVPGKNEVATLYRRLKGLVIVKFKKDILDLPDKVYKEIECKPTPTLLNALKTLAARTNTAIKLLTLSRELSDGFQYVEQVVGTERCLICMGEKTILQADYTEDVTQEDIDRGSFENGQPLTMGEETPVACYNCNGRGEVEKVTREARQIPCPKEDVLRDLLDEYDEVGRVVIYGGFTGSIDRITSIVQSCKWNFVRVDGRGWHSDLPGNDEQMVKNFQQEKDKFPRIAFVGQPSSAGMGLTLTASPVIIYYSNDFNAESRMQSEDRIHRAGMDTNRGATIVDLLHLPTDKLVLDNLKKKRKLQNMSLGEITAAMS